MLFLNWRNTFSTKSSNAYHTVNLLLSEKPAPWNLDKFECVPENKSSHKLYALELLSKELAQFMLNVLNYRAGLEFPESDSEKDSYLERPSVLARKITGFEDDPGEPTILREYLDAMLIPISKNYFEALEKIKISEKRIGAFDDETHPDKFKTAFELLLFHNFLQKMKDKDGKEKMKLDLYCCMEKQKVINWIIILEEARKLTPEQAELYDFPKESENDNRDEHDGDDDNKNIDNNHNKKRQSSPAPVEQRKRHHPEHNVAPRIGKWITRAPSGAKAKKLLWGPVCDSCDIRHPPKNHPIDARRNPPKPLSDFIKYERIREIFYLRAPAKLNLMLYQYLYYQETNLELKEKYISEFRESYMESKNTD
ncbi:unnamed protein product [Ambrosiozyma monospora]|uniref:Unnamed protein product n=1 Tax=Ambrosiozyma monospora TaxID=43982 RepID=A0ACB5T263_AMBMO|nr:unnamed protein product [Ambrosiozyma monospora]